MANGYRWLIRCTQILTLGTLVFGAAACGNGGVHADRANHTEAGQPATVDTVDLQLHDQVFKLELAIDDASRTLGLSDRKTIAEDGGMLFVFPTPVRTQFVMRRCYVPIDLVFIDDAGYIDSLHAMEVITPIGSPRWRNPSLGYPTAGRVRYAVELKGGKIEALGLQRGEKIDLPDAVLQLKPR